jgi:hypothetical protein
MTRLNLELNGPERAVNFAHVSALNSRAICLPSLRTNSVLRDISLMPMGAPEV